MPTILIIALTVLIAAAVWLLVELVLLVRKLGPTIESLPKTIDEIPPLINNVNVVLEQVKPVLDHIDSTLEGIEPAVIQVEPILTRTNDAIAALTSDLCRVDDILSDVSRTANLCGNAAHAVNNSASHLVSWSKGLLSRTKSSSQAPRMPAPQTIQALDEAASSAASGDAASSDLSDFDEEAHTDSEPGDNEVQAAPDIEVARKEEGYFTYPT